MLPCKKCQKVAIEGQEIFMQNLGTKEQPSWIACQNIECFISQGGSKPDSNKKTWTAKKVKTDTERLQTTKLSDPIWLEAEAFVKGRFPNLSEVDFRILTSTIYKGKVEMFKVG